MLSPSVVWVDIEPEQWANLWHHVYASDRRTRRAIGILDQGQPLALVEGRTGQLPLELWPEHEVSLTKIAQRLRAELAVDQVILVEASALAALWDEQQRFLDPDGDYDDYVLGIRYLTELMLREHAVCDPPELRATEVPYEGIRALVRDAVGADGAFLITVFDADGLWWSLAGKLSGGSIIRLTSSQGLLPAGADMPRLPWRDAHAFLIDACKERLGPVHLALGFQLAAFDALLSADDPRTALDNLAKGGNLIISGSET